MNLPPSIRAAYRLMRPAQWPVLSGQFLVAVMLLSPRASEGGCWLNGTALLVLLVAWACWVVFLNGGTLAFNSAYDRDQGPVAYLESPPEPPAWLAVAALLWMGLGTALGTWILGTAFGLTLATCLVLSVLYSHPASRLKGRPGWDLIVNMVGYGAATTLAGLLAGKAAYLGLPLGACATTGPDLLAFPRADFPVVSGSILEQIGAATQGGRGWLVAAFALLFGSFYPDTQVYQREEDQRRGDRTLTTRLGVRRALGLGLVLGVLAAMALGLAWREADRWWTLLLPLAGMTVWLGHHGRWWSRAESITAEEHEQAMYRSLMLWGVIDGLVLVGWLFRS